MNECSVEMSAEESVAIEAELDIAADAEGEMYEVAADDVTDDVTGDADNGIPTWSSRTVAALKSALVERGLQTTGRKADLVARLEASKSGSFSSISFQFTVAFWGLFYYTVRCHKASDTW